MEHESLTHNYHTRERMMERYLLFKRFGTLIKSIYTIYPMEI